MVQQIHGNVARCFFSHPQIVAEVSGLEENLIIRIRDILQALASGCEIDCIKFKEYCRDSGIICTVLFLVQYASHCA